MCVASIDFSYSDNDWLPAFCGWGASFITNSNAYGGNGNYQKLKFPWIIE